MQQSSLVLHAIPYLIFRLQHGIKLTEELLQWFPSNIGQHIETTPVIIIIIIIVCLYQQEGYTYMYDYTHFTLQRFSVECVLYYTFLQQQNSILTNEHTAK